MSSNQLSVNELSDLPKVNVKNKPLKQMYQK